MLGWAGQGLVWPLIFRFRGKVGGDEGRRHEACAATPPAVGDGSRRTGDGTWGKEEDRGNDLGKNNTYMRRKMNANMNFKATTKG